MVEDDERTTIEPGPPQDGDESSTPIAVAGTDEHWEDGTTVAESAKKLLEEATIDDQARTLPPLQLVPPVNPRAQARLFVVTGPDKGRSYELGGGNKAMQVGRAMENDVVLTDLSVSRRHLELVWEGDRWILRDCGSGNGTLINDRLEDGQCQLRNGDRIEIGNTIFRFDHAASVDGDGSIDVPIAGWGQGDDEEELATVNGRPSKSGETELPESRRAQARGGETVPPTSRPRSTTAAPSVPPPRPARATGPTPGPRATERGGPPPPVPEMSAAMRAAAIAVAPAGASASMPGFFAEPVRPTVRSFPPGAQPVMLPPPRAGMMAVFDRYDRRKLFLAIGGGALALAVVIGAVAGGGGPVDDPSATKGPAVPGEVTPLIAPTPGGDVVAPGSGAGSQVAPGSGAGSVIIEPAGGAAVEPGVGSGSAVMSSGSGAGSQVAPGSGAGSAVVAPGSGAGSAVVAPGSGAGSAVVAPGSGAGSTMVAPGGGAGSAVVAPGGGAGSAMVAAGSGPGSTVAATPGTGPSKIPVKPPTRPDPPRPERVERPTRTEVEPPAPRPSASSKAIAAAEKKATEQYRARKFGDAATTLRAAADDASATDAKRLSSLATNYESIGTNLTSGASADAVVAFTALTRALATDRKVGGAHQSFISERLGQVAPTAAKTYVARGKYVEAKRAADSAVNFGAGTNPTIAKVRANLEAKAGALYTEASKMMAKKPDEAKAQLRQITQMVESDSPWYAKASRLLKGSTSRDDDE